MSALLDRFVDRARAAGGRVGAIVIAPDGSEALALDPDGVYLAASVIKLPLVMTLYCDAAAGNASLERRIPVGERVSGSGVLRDLRDVEAMSVRDLALLTVAVSDNTATNRLIDLVGVDRVNEMLDRWGCPTTRLQRAMFDMEAKARGCENVMTPRETASLMWRVAREAVTDKPMADVLALLERNTNTLRLGRYLPKGVTLAHKDGWLDDPEYVDNDAGILRADSKTVVAVGFTHRLPPVVARPLLGLLGAAAAELAGAEVSGLPFEGVGEA